MQHWAFGSGVSQKVAERKPDDDDGKEAPAVDMLNLSSAIYRGGNTLFSRMPEFYRLLNTSASYKTDKQCLGTLCWPRQTRPVRNRPAPRHALPPGTPSAAGSRRPAHRYQCTDSTGSTAPSCPLSVRQVIKIDIEQQFVYEKHLPYGHGEGAQIPTSASLCPATQSVQAPALRGWEQSLVRVLVTLGEFPWPPQVALQPPHSLHGSQ